MEMVKQIITKKEICVHFGLVSPSGKTIYYKKLREHFFNDQALTDLGISPDEYTSLRGGKPFTFHQSRKILEYFDID